MKLKVTAKFSKGKGEVVATYDLAFHYMAVESLLKAHGKYWRWEPGVKQKDNSWLFHAHKGKLFTQNYNSATLKVEEVTSEIQN